MALIQGQNASTLFIVAVTSIESSQTMKSDTAIFFLLWRRALHQKPEKRQTERSS